MTGPRGWLERLAHPVLGLVSQEAEPGEKDCGGGAADASSVAVPEPEASGGGSNTRSPPPPHLPRLTLKHAKQAGSITKQGRATSEFLRVPIGGVG